MEKVVPTASKATQNPERSAPARRAETSIPATGTLAQLAAIVNESPRVQAQLKLTEELRTSGQVAGQQALTSEINGVSHTAQLEMAPTANNTGLPNNLKAGIESLSGVSLDKVKVHYDSPKPAQLNALAYAQGTDIHVAPGQQKHLPHEAWHIAQQSQGRVKPTTQVKGVAINDDSGLEREADVMGAKAAATPVQRQVNQVAQLGKSKGFTKKRNKERRIRENKDKPDNRVWIPSGEIGVGDPPEGYATWLEWIKDKKAGEK